jgi:ABC-2 type transport system permease protein
MKKINNSHSISDNYPILTLNKFMKNREFMVFSSRFRALLAIVQREMIKFWHQKGRLVAALVRPSLWLIVFAAGFQNVFGVSIIPPYETYIEYQEYVIPGLLGMVLLFNGMQSSLAMVYDREMGLMRLLLTAPQPRWFLLFSKLVSGTILSLLQAYAFLILTVVFQIDIPLKGWLYAFPAMLLGGLMLGSLGLLLSVYIKQLENFAGTMNFVIFPMFFISTALYPLWKLQESGAEVVFQLATYNPFTHVVKLIRFALYGQFNAVSFGVVLASGLIFFMLSVWGYNPQRGMAKFIKQKR